jgi:hypothetical protein
MLSQVPLYYKEYNDSTNIAISLPSCEDNAILMKDYLNDNIPVNT